MLTQSQRKLLENVVRRSATGPNLGGMAGLPGNGEQVDAANTAARIWAETWLGDVVQAVLDNDAGKISAAQMVRYFGD